MIRTASSGAANANHDRRYALWPDCMRRSPTSFQVSLVYHFTSLIPIILLVLSIQPQQTKAQDLITNVVQLNNNNTELLENQYVVFLEALDELYTDGTFDIRHRPFARSLREVTQGLSDLHIPLICPKNAKENPYFSFGDEPIQKIIFALYSNIDSPINYQDIVNAKYTVNQNTWLSLKSIFTDNDIKTLGALTGTYDTSDQLIVTATQLLQRDLTADEQDQLKLTSFPYYIATDRIHSSLIDIPTHPSSNPNSAIRQVLGKRVDGYIFAAATVERLITEQHLSDRFHRSLLGNFDVCFVVAKNSHGDAINKKISPLIAELKKTDLYKQKLLKYYRDFDKNWLEKYGDLSKPKP